MKIALGTNQFFDDEGRPLVEGRVSVYKHASDILNDIYTLVGDDYSQATNPVILSNDGRMPTVFFDAAVVDVKVEKLVGDGVYELVDTFEAGFDMPSAQNSTFVYGMNALAEASPDLGIVTVVGYYNDYDAPARNYVWDPYCSDVADGGIVVESNTGNEGRWVLMWEDEKLPSSVYGILPGVNESNISAFIGYSDYVGSYQIRTPKFPRFLGGTYTSGGVFSTTKTLYFDRGAQFVAADIECYTAIIPENDSYVADFYFNDMRTIAHSSWFRTAYSFLGCNAKHMVFDIVNYFTNAQINSVRMLSGVHIDGRARLPITYVNTGKLRLDGCTIDGVGIFNSADYVTFSNTEFKQNWFSMSVSAWDFYNKVIVRTAYLDKILLSNFTDPSVYVKAMEANGATSINLAGRHISSLQTSQITEFIDVEADTMSVMVPSEAITFRNVKVDALYMSAQQLVAEDSTITFGTEPSILGLSAYNCQVGSSVVWVDQNIGVRLEDCHVGISFNRAPDNTSKDNSMVFIGCTFAQNPVIYSKNMSFYRCTTNNNSIKFFPYQDSGVYKMDVILEGNSFMSGFPVEFTKVNDDNCYMVQVNWHIVGNQFLGNANGLVCRYWQNRTGSNYEKRFIDMSTNSSITYSGNYGNCPKSSMKGASINMASTPWKTVETTPGSGNYIYVYTYANERVCPIPHLSSGASENSFIYNLRTPDNNEFKVKHGMDMELELASGTMFWAKGSMANADNGDLFQMGLCSWVVDPGNDAVIVV